MVSAMIVRVLLSALCGTLALANVAFTQVPTADGALQSAVWRWMFSIVDEDTFVAPVDRDHYTVTFGADGSLSIRADCNNVSGTYHQIGRRLTLQAGPTTLVACPPGSRADDFLLQLGAVVSHVATETTLVLNLRQDSGSMVFEAQPVLSLSDTSWLVQAYNNGREAVTTPLEGTQMTVKFDSEGRVSGSSGCNMFSGSYSDDGTTLSIGPLATTRLACAIPILQQEQAFLTALQASTQYELTSEQLTLRNPEGATQVVLLPAPVE